MIGPSMEAISGKPRGDWPWRYAHGPADAAAARRIAGDKSFWLCRSGRRALHEALVREPVRGERRLWIPAFICRVVVPPAEAAGYTIALYDLDDRFMPVLETMQPTPGDAVLAVHFFGLAQPFVEWCRELSRSGITVVEDCAHLLKPRVDGAATGTAGDWAIFSFRKQLPVACGGMLLGARLDGRVTPQISHDWAPRHALLAAERVGPLLLGSRYCRVVEWTRGALEPVRGSGSWHPGDDDAISAMTLRALEALDVDSIARARQRNYRTLVTRLAGAPGIDIPVPDPAAGSVPMVLPVSVERPTAVAAALWALGVGAFLWPGFEVLPDVDWTRFPGSRRLLDHLVCLPVHQDLEHGHLERIAEACTRTVSGKPH